MEKYIKTELEKYQKLGGLQSFVLSLMVSLLEPQLEGITDKKEMFMELHDLGDSIESLEDEPLRSVFENKPFCQLVIGKYWAEIVRYTEIEYADYEVLNFFLGVSENWKNDEEERVFICSDALIYTAGLIGEVAEKVHIKLVLEERKNQ